MIAKFQQISPESFEITLQFSIYGDKVVPEPGTLAMCFLLGMLVVCRRR